MLPEELAERDLLAGRGGIGLIGRTEHDDDVAAAVRMQGIGAVDVAELFLEEDAFHDPLARVGRVGQVVEVVDDLLADELIVEVTDGRGRGWHLRRCCPAPGHDRPD